VCSTDEHIAELLAQGRRDQEEVLAMKRRAAEEKVPLDAPI